MEADAIEGFIGEYGWMAAIAFVFLLGRNTIESAIEAIKVFAGDDLNTDDVITVSYTHLTLPTICSV